MLNECYHGDEVVAAEVGSGGVGDDDGIIWGFESLHTGLNFCYQ